MSKRKQIKAEGNANLAQKKDQESSTDIPVIETGVDHAVTFAPQSSSELARRNALGSDAKGDKSSLSQVDLLLELAADADLFRSAQDTAYADVGVNGNRATWSVQSGAFRKWLRQKFYGATGKALRTDALNEVVNTLVAIAQFEGPCRAVYCRTAHFNGKVYIDLGDENWDAIEIDSDGWRIVSSPPVRFKRSPATGAFQRPVPGGRVNTLSRMLNLRSDAELTLVVSWVLAALAMNAPFPVLVINGEQGSAKSTVSTILRQLVDPNADPIRSLPRNEQDLFVSAQRSRVLAFDNLSGMSAVMSDALCRIATGGAFAARKLYSNDEEVVLRGHNPVLLNGIADTVTRADLGDRAIILHLQAIPDSCRRTASDVFSEFERAHPAIFGALLDGISKGLRRNHTVKLARLSRMADFVRFATACETAFGSEGSFIAAYDSNIANSVDELIDADVVTSALCDFMEKRSVWEGTTTDLLNAIGECVSHGTRRSHDWPSTPQGLSTRLKRAETVLRKFGITLQRHREANSRKRNRILRIERKSPEEGVPEPDKGLSASSAMSKTSPKPSGFSGVTGGSLRTSVETADNSLSDTSGIVRAKPLKSNASDDADDADDHLQYLNGADRDPPSLLRPERT